MYVISIIYIFMIKRRKYIIFGLWARIDMISVAGARCLVLVSKSGRRGETFIGQDGGGEPINTRRSFDRSSCLTGHCSRKCTTPNLVHDLCWIRKDFMSATSVLSSRFSAALVQSVYRPLQIVWFRTDRNRIAMSMKKEQSSPCSSPGI